MERWRWAESSPRAIAACDRNDINATYSISDAVFSAVFINACLRHTDTVRMANMAPVINARGPLFVHPGGIVRRTTFHILEMYANLLGEMMMDALVQSDRLVHEGQSIPALDGIATCDAAGTTLRLALINRDPTENLSCKVTLAGQPLESRYLATMLVGDSPDAYNDIDHPTRVTPERVRLEFVSGTVLLPPHSITIFELDN